MNAVSISGLDKRFGPTRALIGINFEIQAGSSVLIEGANGAGKSTLLRLIAGLARPTRGRIQVLGADPLASGVGARDRIGYLGMKPGLYGELTVRENLDFCARLHGRPAGSVARALEQLQLGDWANRTLQTLSFGYQRRAGLARALLGEPELVLLDEPWTGLDNASAERLSGVLRESHSRGTTLVVAAHGVAERNALFTRRVRLHDGRLES